jgi:hypothetical protein
MAGPPFERTSDPLSVPQDQLTACMAALQDWVLPSRRLIAIAQAADVDTSTLEIETLRLVAE